MPVYNGRMYFEQALISVLTSATDEDEIVVVEDGSTDGGVQHIVERHSCRAAIRYILKPNGGVASALNVGLEVATKPVFSWLSHDDLYLPNRLSCDRALRRVLPDLVTVSNFYLLYEGSGQCIHVHSTRKIGNRQNVKLLGSRFINGNCLSAPVQLLKSVGGFNEALRHTQDYDLWCRLLRTATLTAIPTATVISRQHPHQDSKRAPKAAREEYKQLLLNYLALPEIFDPRNVIEILKIASNSLR
jgi:GT2 family glycosyltransferase